MIEQNGYDQQQQAQQSVNKQMDNVEQLLKDRETWENYILTVLDIANKLKL